MTRHRWPLGVVAALLATGLLTGAATVVPVEAVRVGGVSPACLSVIEVSYAPGQASAAHVHDTTLVAVMLEGAVESQVDDGPLRTYRAGDHWVERPGARHLVSRNASHDRPARFLVIEVAPNHAQEGKTCRE